MGTASWRVVGGTGNCCENYLAATAGGRLLNFGGQSLRYSDDRGAHWWAVTSADPFLGAEGAVAVAPGGDVVAATWDPYTGDRVVAYKFDAAAGAWYVAETPVHTPFFDRPWIGVVPGPITVGAATVPYLSVLMGGFPSKEVKYVSADGLNYAVPSSTLLDALTSLPASHWLTSAAASFADVIQTLARTQLMPLPGGGALALPLDRLACPWRIMDLPVPRWSCFTLPPPAELGYGTVLVDSLGWVHRVAVDALTIDYGLSRDGGQSWTTTVVSLPPDHQVLEYDVKTNGSLGLTVVAVHAYRSGPRTDQDYVYRFSVPPDGAPALTRIDKVGLGDIHFGQGLESLGPRFDFASVVILPDGKVAVSFGDSAHTSPAVAVEL